jgi:hypothetical protein
MSADIGGLVSWWNANWGGYGGMSNDIASIRNRLVGVGFASTYGLQELWNQSRRFRTGAKKCFVRNSAVLMADLSWKMIYDIVAGDMVFSPTGPARIERLHQTTLGDRKMYEMEDGTIEWSSEHMFWIKTENRQWFWTMSRKDLDLQIILMNSPNLKKDTVLYEGLVDKEESFAHAGEVWKKNKPQPSSITAYNYPLYSPITANGELIVVNGYLVDAASDETKQDYSLLNWDLAVTEEVKEAMNNLPISVDSYHKHRKSDNYTPPVIPEDAKNLINHDLSRITQEIYEQTQQLSDADIASLIAKITER